MKDKILGCLANGCLMLIVGLAIYLPIVTLEYLMLRPLWTYGTWQGVVLGLRHVIIYVAMFVSYNVMRSNVAKDKNSRNIDLAVIAVIVLGVVAIGIYQHGEATQWEGDNTDSITASVRLRNATSICIPLAIAAIYGFVKGKKDQLVEKSS